MTDRPILFSAPMVRALIAEAKQPGTGKTMTRRVLKAEVPKSPGDSVNANNTVRHAAPYLDAYNRTSKWCWWTRDDRCCLPQFDVGYATGHRLWVKETHRLVECDCPDTCRVPGKVWYEATADGYRDCNLNRLRPSPFMPRWASRLTLTVTAVRVERLQNITESDAEAEGSREPSVRELGGACAQAAWTERQVFSRLWDHINGKRPGAGWDDNPWVVALTFTVALRNIDAMEAVAA